MSVMAFTAGVFMAAIRIAFEIRVFGGEFHLDFRLLILMPCEAASTSLVMARGTVSRF